MKKILVLSLAAGVAAASALGGPEAEGDALPAAAGAAAVADAEVPGAGAPLLDAVRDRKTRDAIESIRRRNV